MGKHVLKGSCFLQYDEKPGLKNLTLLNEEFKKHRKRELVKKYFLRFLFIAGLMVFIIAGYSIWVLGDISRKLASHSGIREAKKVLGKPIDASQPLTFLIIGSDSRGKENGRADTIIVVRVYLQKERVILISIPRDYRVKVPGYGKRKINSAYALGGSRLMIETVSRYLDLEINHYAVIDFVGFKKVVDSLGGVTVNVEKRLYEKGHSNINLYPGVQRLNGNQALAFVRFRHDKEGDFGRIRRQQEFIRALSEEFLTPAAIPRYPRIANIIAENLETDMSISELIGYARLYAGFENKDIQAIMLPGETKNINGVSFVVPEEEKVKLIIDIVKKYGRLPKSNELVDPSNISVRVLNGTGAKGLARAGTNYIKDLGFRVFSSGNADRFDYIETLIIFTPGHQGEGEFVREKLGFGKVVPYEEKFSKLLRGVDVGIILGFDAEAVPDIKERLIVQ